MYSAWGQFLLPENLRTNRVILKCKLWEWVWEDLYNLETFFWFIVITKKYITPLLILARGATLHPPSDVYVRSFVPFYTLIKLCYTKALEWPSLVCGPEAKSSSSEITSLTSFTMSYHNYPCRITPKYFHSQKYSSKSKVKIKTFLEENWKKQTADMR